MMMNFLKSPAHVQKQVQAERRVATDKVEQLCPQDAMLSATEKLAELREKVIQVIEGNTPVEALDLAAYKKFMTNGASPKADAPAEPPAQQPAGVTQLPKVVTGSAHKRRTG